MRIAILILAHKNPEQLRSLINILKTDFEVFVHIDKGASFYHQFSNEEHVHILEKRHAAYWGSYQSIEAMLELFRSAYSYNCDFYMLISGQDLPVRPNKEIIQYFEQHPFDHVEYDKLTSKKWQRNGGLDRMTLYWETKYESNHRKLSLGTFIYKTVFFVLRKMQKTFRHKRSLDFDCYAGPNWINLTPNAVKFILDFTKKNKWYSERFHYTRCADEIFFQTLLLSFDYSDKHQIVNDNKRYVDWTSGPEYPRNLEINDYEKIISSDAFFARKFDQERDKAIIQKILERAQV